MRLIQGLLRDFNKLDENTKGVFIACAIALYCSGLMFVCCNLIVMFGGK